MNETNLLHCVRLHGNKLSKFFYTELLTLSSSDSELRSVSSALASSSSVDGTYAACADCEDDDKEDEATEVEDLGVVHCLVCTSDVP